MSEPDFYLAPSMSRTAELLDERRKVFDWRLKHLTDVIKQHKVEQRGSLVDYLPVAELPIPQTHSEAALKAVSILSNPELHAQGFP
jgi:hypothetical protein